jgi:membrane-associated phospholipid phosphatase
MIIQVWDIWLIRYLQISGDWLKPVMEFFTVLGYPQAYMVMVAVVYWSFDRKLGLRLALFLTLDSSMNSILKMAFHAPRPYWVTTDIEAIHASRGFGMPSGHAQASVVWLLAGTYLHRKWFWIIAILITFLIGLSRAYLGVHFPSQILAGWLIGIAIMICFLKFKEPVTNWVRKLRLSIQLLMVLGVSVLILLAGAISLVLTAGWDMPLDWARKASAYLYLDRTMLRSDSMASLAGNAGGFMGVAMGAILMDRRGGFETTAPWWIRLSRVIIGLSCMSLIYVGLQEIMPPEDRIFTYATWRFMGFYLIAFLAVYLAPVILLRLRLLRSNHSHELPDEDPASD